MTIPTEVAAVIAKMRASPSPGWNRNNALDGWADRIESALTKAEAVAVRKFSAWVGDMKTSAGMDYYVCVGYGPAYGEYLTANNFKVRGRAEYEVAEWNHLCGRCEKPDILAFDTNAPPAVPVESLGRDAEPDEVAEYVDDYEYRGETEDGRDACYTPNERERLLIEDAIRGWEDRTTAAAPVASVPDGFALVPSKMYVAPDQWDAAQFAFGGPGSNAGEPFYDCTLWVGEIENDDGSKTHGLHVSCDECPEEGSITLSEFAPPTNQEGAAT